MKNIHILPTDKPSRLRIGDNRNFVFGLIQNSITSKNNSYTNQNLYITNSENIKEGDWYYTKRFGLGVYKNIGDLQIETTTNDYKKIILTTDSDLIKDGVQAIDDDFLEWFVKNPRCEEVELGLEHYFDKNIDKSPFFPLRYKIIIPTEEPKQTVQEYEQQGLEKYSNELVEPKQDYTSKHIEHCHNIAMESLVKEPKQETINEVAERLVKEHPDFKLEGYTEYQNGRFNGIIEGIEWQQEQDKKMYSDEEVLVIFEQFKMNLPFHYEFLVKEALQQLKKK